uniref:JmjC domain-containing protein n=1 Tax=Percolomonas cosmopolitus TaxID=63605 RepID=A0A7S1PJ13_9EUKA|mmetsp:Transcript_8301/g.30630  ORF Transcript_8301/g.30630 Transcript_8301/m.30630 type:complete len:263 (+) Transcript_8301:63-851(+)
MELDILAQSHFQWNLFEQRLGDFIVLPGNCAHQVQKYKGYSIKVVWNNLTPKALRDAMAIQNTYRIYRKDTVYRLKTIAYFSLKHVIQDFNANKYKNARQAEDLCALLCVYAGIIHHENIWDDDKFDEKRDVKMITEDQHLSTCDHCRADIFNRHYYSPSQDKDLCLNCTSATGSRKPTVIWVTTNVQATRSSVQSAHFCFNCLKNMFGKNPSNVLLSTDYKCPKCMKLCYCSKCMPNPPPDLEKKLKAFLNQNAETCLLRG